MVFVLVVVFSGMIMRPFAEVYAKQRRFVTDANHELKTPLTVIGAACEILEYNSGENEWTDTIKDQVGRLTELTNKLVFLSKMDEDGTHAVMTDFSRRLRRVRILRLPGRAKKNLAVISKKIFHTAAIWV